MQRGSRAGLCFLFGCHSFSTFFDGFTTRGGGSMLLGGMLEKVAMDLGRLDSLIHGQITITTCCFMPKIIFTD